MGTPAKVEVAPDHAKEQAVTDLLHELGKAFEEKDSVQQNEKMKAVVTKATTEQLEQLHTRIQNQVDVPPIFKQAKEKEFALKLVTQQRENLKKQVEKGIMERAKEEIEAAHKDIKEHGWLTGAKYAGLIAGGAFAAKWLWDHTIGALLGTEGKPGWLSKIGGWLTAAGGALLGFTFARGKGGLYDFLPTWVKAPADGARGAFGEVEKITGELMKVVEDLGIVWDGKGDLLTKLFESGCVIVCDGGNFVISRLGRMVTCPIECAKKMLNGEGDMWVAYGSAGVSYIVGRSMASAIMKGRIGELIPSGKWKMVGKVALWPLSAGKDAFDTVRQLSSQAGRQAGVFKINEHLLMRLVTQPNMSAKALAVTGSSSDYAQAIKRWKYLAEIREGAEKGGNLAWHLSDADIAYVKNAEFELAKSLQEGAQKLKPNGAEWAQKIYNKRGVVRAEEFREVLSEVSEEAIAYGKEAKMIAPFLKDIEAPVARFALVRKELESLYGQRKTLPSTDPELDKVNAKITKLEQESKVLQKDMQGILAQAEGKLPEDVVKNLRGQMGEQILGRTLGTAEREALHEIHMAGEDAFSKICKQHAPNIDADLLRRASPQEVSSMTGLSEDAKNVLNQAKKARLEAKITKMDELHKAGKWGVGLDSAALKNERLLLFESGIAGRVKPATEVGAVMKGAELGQGLELAKMNLLKLGAAADDANILRVLRESGASEQLIAKLESSPGALRMYKGAIATGQADEVGKVLRIGSKASVARIPLAALGVGADVFAAYMAYEDLMANEMDIALAKKTGNRELQGVYETARIVHATNLGVNGTAVVIGTLAFFSSAAATASVVLIPVAMLTMVAAEGWRQTQAITEDVYKTYKEYLHLTPSQLLVQIRQKSEKDGRLLGSALISLASWSDAHDIGARAGTLQLPELCFAYIMNTAQLSAAQGESEQQFKMRLEIYIRDAISYLHKSGIESLNAEAFAKARIHADLCAKSRQAQAMKESYDVHGYKLEDYSKPSESSDPKDAQEEWKKRKEMVERTYNGRFEELAGTLNVVRSSAEKRKENRTHASMQRVLLGSVQDEVNMLRRNLEEHDYSDILAGDHMHKRVAVVMASRLLRSTLKNEVDGLTSLNRPIEYRDVLSSIQKLKEVLGHEPQWFQNEGVKNGLAEQLRARTNENATGMQKDTAEAAEKPWNIASILINRWQADSGNEGLEELEMAWMMDHVLMPIRKQQPLETHEQAELGTKLLMSKGAERLPDGSYRLQGEGESVWFRLEKGTWEWRGVESAPWQPAATGLFESAHASLSPAKKAQRTEWNRIATMLQMANKKLDDSARVIEYEVNNADPKAGTTIDNPFRLQMWNKLKTPIVYRGESLFFQIPFADCQWQYERSDGTRTEALVLNQTPKFLGEGQIQDKRAVKLRFWLPSHPQNVFEVPIQHIS